MKKENTMKASQKRTAKLRIGALGVITAAAVALSGCAAGAPQNDSGKKTLNAIFLPADWGKVVQEKLAPEYEKETGVKVNVELVGRDAIHEKMATLFAGQDSSYDIFNVDYNWIPEFGKGGHLVPLDNALQDKEDFLPLSLKVATWDNKLLGIPQTVHPATLWYNGALYSDQTMKDQYQAETGTALAVPKTMDEWMTQVKFFNGKTFKGQKLSGWAAQAAKGFGNVHTWLSFAYSFGCNPFNTDFTKSTLTTPECIGATERWSEMMKYMPAGANDFTYDSVTTAAQQGSIATAIQWSWGQFATDNPSASKTVGDWQMTTIPTGPTGLSSAHLAEWVISVSKYSKNTEEATKFAVWLESKKNDVLQAANGGGDPVRVSSYSDPTLTEQKLEGNGAARFRRLPVTLEAMKTAQPRPFFPGEESWETALSTELSAISLGQRSVQEGLSRANEAVDKNLSQ
jgi:multiple sugar transport system substrate-binding protein